MYIDLVGDKLVIELGEFDIEKTQIDLGINISIGLLRIPEKYRNFENLQLLNIISKVDGEIEYIKKK